MTVYDFDVEPNPGRARAMFERWKLWNKIGQAKYLIIQNSDLAPEFQERIDKWQTEYDSWDNYLKSGRAEN